MKILLTGSEGQLGISVKDLKPKNIILIETNRNTLDLCDSKKCFQTVLDLKPDWIINCGAYTNVDLSESKPDIAYKINSQAPEFFAKALKITGGKLLQISTDYVFNGNQNTPYLNIQRKDPISIYGKSKALGEDKIVKELKYYHNYYILRTSWLMGPKGNNFASKIINLNSKKDFINVVSDQYGSPTSTNSLANIIWEIIIQEEKFNKLKQGIHPILHWSDEGITSRYDLAVAIGEISLELGLINRKAKVFPIKSSSDNNSYLRPRYSKLDCEYTKQTLGLKGVYWRDSLYTMLKMKVNDN